MRIVVLTLLLSVAFPLVWADESLLEFQRDVSAPAAEGVGAVAIDAAVYGNLLQGFKDIRLMRSRDGEVLEWPYVIEKVSQGRVKTPARILGSKTVSFEENEDGSIETVVRLNKTLRGARSLRIDTPLRDFEKSIDVSGSSDGENWEPLVGGALVFDRERYLDFRRTEVEIPENVFTYYKVVIANATEEQQSSVREVTEAISSREGESVHSTMTIRRQPFRMDGLAFYTAKVDLPDGQDEIDYPVALVSSVIDEEDQSTEVIFEAGRVPLRSVTVDTPDVNFRRTVRLEVPKGEDDWLTIKRDVIHRYRIGEVDEEDLTLRFDEQRSDRFRLVIENGDNPALKVSDVSGTGEAYEVRFLVEPGDELSLLYGSASFEVASPQYDVAAIQRAIKGDVQILPLTLQAESKSSFFTGKSGRKLSLLEQPWILWLLIGVVVAVLIRVLVGAAKKVEEMGE